MSVIDIPEDLKNLSNKFEEYNENLEKYKHHHEHLHRPTIAELDQFKRSWFYDNWNVRFRKLAAFSDLGTKGVQAIPNTTFIEWLYWFQEWAVAFMDDYNEFKRLVYQALLMIEKHLEAIDKTLEDHEERIEKLEHLVDEIIKALKTIWNKIQDLQHQIDQINSKITDIENKISDLQKQIDDLRNMVKTNASPVYMDATPNDAGAQNGWHRNSSAHPNGLNLQYRWVLNNDHSQGMYLRFNFNRIVNDSYQDPNDKTIAIFDLTNFVNETGAQIPHEGWITTSGSYWNDQQRAGLQYHYTYDSGAHKMTVQIDRLFGLNSAHKSPERLEISAISNEFFIHVNK